VDRGEYRQVAGTGAPNVLRQASREIKIAKPSDMGFCDGSVTAITETRLFLRHLPRELLRKSHVAKATDVCSHCCWDRSSSHSRDVVLGASDGGWDQFALMRLAQAPLARPTEPTRLVSRLRSNQEWSRHLIATFRSRFQ